MPLNRFTSTGSLGHPALTLLILATASMPQVAEARQVGPVFRGGMAQTVAELADPAHYIRQRIWVETDFDSDRDGKPDRIHVDILRPGAAEAAGLKVPVIMQSSPYFGGTNGPRAYLWDVHQELGTTPPPRQSAPEQTFNPSPPPIGGLTEWVGRGFAVVSSEQPGTGLSTGCPTVGDYYETTAPKFVIDWLNGRARGFTSVDGNEEVSAASWTTGKVGMIGTSYNGTLPLSAALTGVDGLEAIVPIAPNTSYYHYYRSNGLVRSPGSWLGEDIDFLYDYVHSGRNKAGCNAIWRDSLFASFRDRARGDFNPEWAKRDQLPLIGNVKAAVWFAHGLNDFNVVPEHTIRMWNALKGINPKAKLYLHQGGHGGGPPADSINKWFSHYLYGIDNGIDRSARVLVVPSIGAAAPEPSGGSGRGRGGRGGQGISPALQGYPDWPIPGSAPVTLRLGRGGQGVGQLGFGGISTGIELLVDDVSWSPNSLAAVDSSAHRLLYATPVLTDTLHLSGTPTFTIRMSSSKAAANLSVYLLMLPYDSSGIGTAGQRGVVTRGWADPQNWRSLTRSGNYNSLDPGEPLTPDRFVTLTFDLQPDDQLIPPGKQLALMIFSSDRDFTLWPEAGTRLSVDLSQTKVTLPIVGGEAAARRAGVK